MKPINEPFCIKPDTDHERLRNRMEAVVCIVGALAFCWWLGGRIHAAVLAGSRPFVAAAESVAQAVSGK